MSDHNCDTWKQTMAEVKHRRRTALTRRQVLQASSATAIAAIAANFVPREVRADVTGEVVHLTASGSRFAGVVRGLMPLFEKAYPNVTLNVATIPTNEFLNKVNVYMQSKSDAFDSVTQDYGQYPSLESFGAMIPLQAHMDADPTWFADYQTDVPEALQSLYRIPIANSSGTLYGLAHDANCQMTFYRKDIFDKAGIPVPRTWPDALEAAKELHSPGTNQYGYVGAMQRSYWAGYQYYGALRSFGGALVDSEEPGYWNPTVNSEEGYMALKMLVDLQQYAHPVSANAGEDEVNTAFANGTAVYGPLTWGTAVLNDPSFTKFDRVIYADLPPRGDNEKGAHRVSTGGFGVFVPTYSKNQEAGVAFAKFLASGDARDPAIGEAVVAAGGQPARLSILDRHKDDKLFFGGLMASMPYGVTNNLMIPEGFTIGTQNGVEVADAINGEQSIEQALTNMDKGIRRVLEDAGYYA